MSLTDVATDETRRGAAAPPSRPVASLAVLAVATVVSFGWRLLLAAQVGSPFIYQDEGGYAAVARMLVGDAPELYGPAYLPGLGLLLTPAALFDASTFHDVAQGLNALLAALMIPALYAMARRVVGLEPWLSVGVAITGATTAASVLQATMLLPETLFALLTVLSVLAVHRVATAPTTASALAAGAVLGATYVVHPRGIVTVGAGLLVLGAATRLTGASVATVGRVAAATVGVAVVGQLFHGWAVDRLYPLGTWETLAGSPLESLGEPAGVAVITAGHLWYLLVATFGLAAVGVVAASAVALRRDDPAWAASTFVVVGVVGSLALAAMASYTVGAGDVNRADQPVYGRYLEQWLPILVVWAPSLVRSLGRVVVPAIAAATLLLGWAVEAAHDDAVWRLPVAWHNIASLRLAVERYGREFVSETAPVVAVLTALLLAAAFAWRARWSWLPVLGAMLAANALAGAVLVDEWAGPASRAWADRHRAGEVIEDAGLEVSVGIESDFHVFYAYNLQFWHPDVDLVLTEGPLARTAGLHVGGEVEPPRPGAVLVDRERSGNIGIWALDDTSRVRYEQSLRDVRPGAATPG